MNASRYALLALCLVPLCIPSSVLAQDKDTKWDNPWDLKPLVPPGFALPPNSQLSPGTLNSTQTPYSTAPLQAPGSSSTQQTPGIRLTIPSH